MTSGVSYNAEAIMEQIFIDKVFPALFEKLNKDTPNNAPRIYSNGANILASWNDGYQDMWTDWWMNNLFRGGNA